MAPAPATSTSRRTCAHCGLPVSSLLKTAASRKPAPGELFCCHACRLAAAIIGREQRGDHSWNLLRLGVAALLAMNVMMISLLLYTGSVEAEVTPLFHQILLGLSLPSLAILIPPFLAGAARELRAGKPNLDLLIALGSLSAFVVSAVNAVRGSGEIYFDTATMLPLLVTLGKLVEASAKSRAAELLGTLEALLPATALRATPAGMEEVGIEQLCPGDLVRIRPGERIAVDGVILEGTGSIEEAHFSGEFLPRLCAPGDTVIAGTVNGTGSLLVRAERSGKELLLHRIVEMIQDAWRYPSRGELMAQRAAALFIPAVLGIAAGSLAVWIMLGEPGQGLLSALSVLVVACPCSMGIATPLATSLAIARAARGGVVVRGGSVMERMAKTEAIFFDKTGTVTEGRAAVQEVRILDPLLERDELLGRLAALESGSGHPFGKAVLDMAGRCGTEPGSAAGIRTFPGKGISGTVTWRGVAKEMTAGSASFVAGDAGSPAPEGGRSVIDVAWENELRARLFVADAVRPEARRCVEALAASGISCALLSGDRLAAAAATAAQVGIEEVHAPRTPEQKLEAISAAVAAGRKVAMVGDGINDAPALAAADTGIALGGGMELAKQAGNVVILSGELMQIPWLISLSRRTGRVIRGNFVWSFGYNAIALAAAAAGLLHPLLAALLMVVSSLTLLGNSLRITAFPDHEHPAPALAEMDLDPASVPDALGSVRGG